MCMFKALHALHDVSSLRCIFFSDAGNVGILSQAGHPYVHLFGIEELQRRVFKCGEYVRLCDSPTGWKPKKQ